MTLYDLMHNIKLKGTDKVIKKVLKIKSLEDRDLILDDLKYWLNKTPEERVSTVEYLRKQHHGSTARFQRVVRIVQRS
ncbi:unnamed protein product [marine sediment metagenome]|uniref:Uncharacterized protein n=1 Tax=marine sediment metagenome TaxID=412755 RepID=X0WFW8_9ZZZZ